MKTIAFFNNKGGVGKTTLVYHLAWMFSELGMDVIAADFDPQANLTSAFLSEERVEEIWSDGARSILAAVQPLQDHLGDIKAPYVEQIDRIALLPGDLALNAFEDRLAEAWPRCLEDTPSTAGDAFRVMSAFRRVIETAGEISGAKIALIDVGPNLGALNRAALIASDYVVMPIGADLFSLRGLANLGPKLRDWREGWRKRRLNPNAPKGLPLPEGRMESIGYVVLQHAVWRADRPAKAYQRWIDRMPATYRNAVLGQVPDQRTAEQDENRLATLKHYRSLMPLAQEARKPIFALKPADGAIGSMVEAVQNARQDFESLAMRIARVCGFEMLLEGNAE
jgi:chromosome partitioning protein